MFKIGDFSKLSRVSIKMLRHYDELGLLEPCHADAFTGYRYYSASQIPRLNRILALKEIGFPLCEIASILEKELPVEEMVQILFQRKEAVLKTIEAEKSKVSRIEAYVRIIEQEAYDMKYEIVLKEIPQYNAVSLRGILPNYEEEGILWNELGEYVKDGGIKCTYPSYAIYHDIGYKEKDVDVEVMHAVTEPVQGTDRIKYRELEAVKEMACVIHKGPFQTMHLAYNAATKWLEENQYEMIAPLRAIYLKGAWNEPNPEEWITEVQVPVKKR